jgi:hypothetical protein
VRRFGLPIRAAERPRSPVCSAELGGSDAPPISYCPAAPAQAVTSRAQCRPMLAAVSGLSRRSAARAKRCRVKDCVNRSCRRARRELPAVLSGGQQRWTDRVNVGAGADRTLVVEAAELVTWRLTDPRVG